MQTFTFILTSLIGIAFSLLYLRRFLFNPKVHTLLKLLSLIVIIPSCLFFFFGEAKTDIKIEAILGLIVGIVLGIIIPWLLVRMHRPSLSHTNDDTVVVHTFTNLSVASNPSLKHPEFASVVKAVFDKEKVTYHNAEELRREIIARWQTLKFSYVASTGKAFCSSNIPVFIDELMSDLTHRQ